jgi:hypothetical protein
MPIYGPHLLLANTQGCPPLSLQRAEERIGRPRQLPGQNCYILENNLHILWFILSCLVSFISLPLWTPSEERVWGCGCYISLSHCPPPQGKVEHVRYLGPWIRNCKNLFLLVIFRKDYLCAIPLGNRVIWKIKLKYFQLGQCLIPIPCFFNWNPPPHTHT